MIAAPPSSRLKIGTQEHGTSGESPDDMALRFLNESEPQIKVSQVVQKKIQRIAQIVQMVFSQERVEASKGEILEATCDVVDILQQAGPLQHIGDPEIRLAVHSVLATYTLK